MNTKELFNNIYTKANGSIFLISDIQEIESYVLSLEDKIKKQEKEIEDLKFLVDMAHIR